MAKRTISILCLIGSMLAGASNVALGEPSPFYCFFDLGSVDLTDRCQQVIREAVASRQPERRQDRSNRTYPPDRYAPSHTTRLRVLGYAPDAASPADADRLSLRRATAVAARLRELGVGGDLITVVGLGSKAPLLPNAPAEPMNRVVNIVFCEDARCARGDG